MWERPPLILVADLHKSFRLNIFLLENRNLWAPFKSLNSKTRVFPQPMLPILTYCFHYSLHGGVNVWLGPFRVLGDRVLFRVLSRSVLFRVLIRVLSDSVLFRVFSSRFLVCRVPSVASTTWVVLQWFSILNISISTDVLIFSLGNLMQLPEIWASFWKEKKILHLRCLTGFWLHLCRVIYIQKYSSRGIPKDSFSQRFIKISRKVSLTEYFSKKL